MHVFLNPLPGESLPFLLQTLLFLCHSCPCLSSANMIRSSHPFATLELDGDAFSLASSELLSLPILRMHEFVCCGQPTYVWGFFGSLGTYVGENDAWLVNDDRLGNVIGTSWMCKLWLLRRSYFKRLSINHLYAPSRELILPAVLSLPFLRESINVVSKSF